MPEASVSRRDFMRGSAALAACTLASRPLAAWGLEPESGETLIPFLDVQPSGKMLKWQNLTEWITASEDLYEVSHYPKPKIEAGSVDPSSWKVEFSGYLKHPKTLTLADLQARPHKTITATLECGGNGLGPGFMGAIGNMRWTGTPLGPILKELGLIKRSEEVVFYGSDEQVEKIREQDYRQNFARSLTVEHALRPEVMLVWAMNGEPLAPHHGYPLRLMVPGWFGIAWVKWLKHVEVLDRRFMGKWMAREYVTLTRDEEPSAPDLWRETSVANQCVKSMTARAVRRRDGSIRLTGAAWSDGTPISRVEVRIDDGPWLPATLDAKPEKAPFTWTFWHYDWKQPTPGDHYITSRSVDADGRRQPAGDDPIIKNKKTHWDSNQQWTRKLRLS
jgi:DMSO/TMAO reductase YedYZ molybdopterin-dependent catalytic subunit